MRDADLERYLASAESAVRTEPPRRWTHPELRAQVAPLFNGHFAPARASAIEYVINRLVESHVLRFYRMRNARLYHTLEPFIKNAPNHPTH